MGTYTASDKRPVPNSGLATRDYRKDCAKRGLRNRVVLVLKSSYWYAVEPRGPTLTGISYKDAVNQKNHSINQESALQIIINHKSPKQITNLKYKSANRTNHCLN